MELKEYIGIKQLEEIQVAKEDDQLAEEYLPTEKLTVVITTENYLIEIEVC